jgi:hypothetical protein
MPVQVISTEPLFFGGVPTGIELSAEEFLDRQEAFMAKADVAVADRMASTTNNLRKEAREWWTTTLPNRLGPADFEIVRDDWATFVNAFKLEFFAVARQNDASIDWAAYKQKVGETAYHFAGRVFNAALLFDRLVRLPGADVIPADLGPAAGDNNPDIVAFRADAVGLGAGPRRGMRAWAHAHALGFRDQHVRRHATAMTLRVLLRGTHDLRLRDGLLRAAREVHPFQRIVTDLREVELHLQRKTGRVAGVGEEDNDDDDQDDIAAVNAEKLKKLKKDKQDKKKKAKAAKAAKQQSGQQQGQRQQQPARPGPGGSKTCTFCHRSGHLVADCRTMRYASENQRSKRGEEGQLAGTGDGAGYHGVAAAQAGGADDRYYHSGNE